MSKVNLFKRAMATFLALAMFFTVLPGMPLQIFAEGDDATGETPAGQGAEHISSEIIDSATAGVDYADKGLGKNGYVVFQSVTATATKDNIESITVTADSNLYAEGAALSGFGRDGSSANWIKDSDGNALNPQEGVSAPIDKWSIISRDIYSNSSVTNALSGGNAHFWAYSGTVGQLRPVSLILNKTSEADITVTIYAYMLKGGPAAYSFGNVAANVSVYKSNRTEFSYDGDSTTLPEYGEQLGTTAEITSGVGAFVTFKLSGVGQFEIVLSADPAAKTGGRPAIGGFWMDEVSNDDDACQNYTVSEAGQILYENGEEVTDNEITMSGILDLNGQSAAIKVTGNNTVLSVVDTKLIPENGADLTGVNAGKLTVTEGADKIADWTQFGAYKYLKVLNDDGTYTFHPFNLIITRMGLNTATGHESVCLQVTFIADDVVRDLLIAEGGDYGLKLLTLDGAEKNTVLSVKNCDNDAYKFTAEKNGVRAYVDLTDSLTNANFDKTGEFKAYIKIGDQEIVSNYTAVITPRQVMEELNNSAAIDPTSEQKARIQALWNSSENYTELKDVLTKFQSAE